MNAIFLLSGVVSIILVIVATCGNLLIILSIHVDPLRKPSTPFNHLLVNLAISGLLVGVATMPVLVVSHFQGIAGWLDRNPVKFAHLSYFLLASSSVLNLGALCMDRCFATQWPLKYRSSFQLSRCRITSLSIWILSAVLFVLYLKVPFTDYMKVFVLQGVSITLFILALTYHQIRSYLNSGRSIHRSIREEAKMQDLRRINSEKKSSNAFMLILILYMCCYSPAVIMLLMVQFCDKCDCILQHVLRDVQFLLILGSSTVVPSVCVLRLKTFRKAITNIIGAILEYKSIMGKPKDVEQSSEQAVRVALYIHINELNLSK